MPKLLATTLLSISLAAASVAAEGAGAADPNFPISEQVRELLAEGVKEYRSGRLNEATKSFHEALKLNPENRQLYEFYLAVGDAQLLRMSEYDVLDDVLKDLLRRARIYQQGLRTSPEYINTLIGKLEKSEEERLVAINELAAIGPLAVPHIIVRLIDNRQDDMRVYCRVVLSRMGYRAVTPLVAALRSSDERLLTSVIASLADIGDARALPYLVRIRDAGSSDTVKRVALNAITVVAERSHVDGLASADQLFFQEGLRYFRGDDLVRDEALANEFLIWTWDDKAEDVAQRLQHVRVARHAWNELMSEGLVFDGLASYPTFVAYYPLLAATYAAQDVEAQRHARLAKENTTTVASSEDSLDVLAARVQTLNEMHLRVRMFGAENVYRALQTAITSDRLDVATYLLRLLEDRGLANPDDHLPTVNLVEKTVQPKATSTGSEAAPAEPTFAVEKAGAVVVAALDHPDKMVRYQAAITLAKLDPNLRFVGAEKVTAVLADALGEWGMRVVLVVDADFRQRNVAREQLQSKGYRVYTAPDGFDCMLRLKETPIKDAIILSGELVPRLRDTNGALIDVPEQTVLTLLAQLHADWRAEKTPIFVSLPENATLAAKIQTLLDGKVTGFVHKPFNAQELSDQVEAALKDANLPNANREDAEDVSLRAAQALAGIDALHTQFDVTVPTDALIATLPARSDVVRIAALQALGNAAKGPSGATLRKSIDKITDAYGANDATLSPELRAAFLYAIGQINPNTEAATSILLRALQHDNADVRTAAAKAVGHAPVVDANVLYRFQLQQRLDLQKQALPAAGSSTP